MGYSDYPGKQVRTIVVHDSMGEHKLIDPDDPFGRDIDLHTPRGRQMLQQIEADAAEKRRKEQEAAYAAEARAAQAQQWELEASEKAQQLADIQREAATVMGIAKVQFPQIPSGAPALAAIMDQVEKSGDDLSIESVYAAAQHLFSTGQLVPDYSAGARQRAIDEIEGLRRQGFEIPTEWDKDPNTFSPKESQEFMRKMKPVSTKRARSLDQELKAYQEWKTKKSSSSNIAQRPGRLGQAVAAMERNER